MRILLATPLYPPESGGPSTYAKMLTDELPQRGIEVALLKFSDVRYLPAGLRHLLYFYKCLWRSRSVQTVYALDTFSVGLPAAFAALAMGKDFLLRVPGDYAWEQGRQRFGITDELDAFQSKKYGWKVEFLRRLQKFVANRAKKIVVPSEYMHRIVSTWIKDPSKIEVIYSSVQLPVEFVLPATRGEGFLVVTIARRVPWKGIEALERVVHSEAGWNFKLLDGLPHTEAMGWVKAANAFALNSTYEGLSHALIETMSLGTPIVATSVGGNPELITDGQTGLLIPPKDDAALHRALKQIETNSAAAQSRAERAMDKVKEFSITVTIEKLARLLKSV